MLRFLFRFLLFVLAVGVIALAVGPLLVDPTPAPGASTGKALALPDSHFVEVPFPGTDGIVLHYLEQDRVRRRHHASLRLAARLHLQRLHLESDA